MVIFVGTAQNYVKSLQIQQKAKNNFYNACNNAGGNGWQSNMASGGAAFSAVFSTAPSYDYYSSQVNMPQERDEKLEQITLRLKQGKRLTSSELSYLSEKEPALYAKAVRIMRERDEYEIELKRCKTKEDVRKLRVIKVQSLIPEVNKAAARNDLAAATEIEMRLNAINDEHNIFIMSRAYQRLPKNYEELNKKRDRIKSRIAAKSEPAEQLASENAEDGAVSQKDEILQALDELPRETEITEDTPEMELEIETEPEQQDAQGAGNSERNKRRESKREE